MRTPWKFRPAPLLLLEERVVLSHVHALATAVPPVSRPPANVAQTLTPSEMVTGAPAAPAGGNTFALSIGGTEQVGLPVYEQRETTYNTNVAPRLVDELIVPNGGGMITTTEWISLKNNGGIEKEVNVETVSGAMVTHQITITEPNGTVETQVQTAVSSGNSTTHTNVTTGPSGTVSTNQYTDITQGKKTLITNGSEPGPNGTTATYSGMSYKVGSTTYTFETFKTPAGLWKKTETAVTSFGDSGSSEIITTMQPHHRTKITSNSTGVSRLNPPAA